MKIVFSYIHSTARPPLIAGPFSVLYFDHEAIRERPGGPAMAVHRNRHWEFEGEHFPRLDVSSVVRIHFQAAEERRSRPLGPFKRFSLFDGLIYGDDKAVAHLDKEKQWFCYDLADRWPVLVVHDAEQGGGR